MKIFKVLVGVVMVCMASAAVSATVVEVAFDPSSHRTSQESWRIISSNIKSARSGDRIVVFDPVNNRSIANMPITDEMVNASSEQAKTVWFMKQNGEAVGAVKRFLNTPPSGEVDLVRYLRGLEARKPSYGSAVLHAIYIGTPLVMKPAAYNMQHRYPSDGLLSSPESLFITQGRERALAGVTLHVLHSANGGEFSDRDPLRHAEKLKRFYSLFIQREGGALATFQGSIDPLLAVGITKFPKASYTLNEMDMKPAIWEVLPPQLEQQDAARQSSLWRGAVGVNPGAPGGNAFPIEVGIAWEQAVDVDIYVRAAANDAELFYRQTASPMGGRFLKDILTQSTATRGFETVLYDSPVMLKQVEVWVNHYGGRAMKPIDVELRLRVDGRVYSKRLQLAAGDGTHGTGQRASNPSWQKVDIAKLIGI